MDEVSFLYDFKDIVPLGGEHSSLGAVADDVARHMGLQVSPDPLPEEVYFIRSDQYSFILQGVPSLYIGEGLQTVDPTLDGKKMQLDWENQRYHLPSDDMNQPLDFNATVKCTRVDLAVGYEVAQQTQRPHWNREIFSRSSPSRIERKSVGKGVSLILAERLRRIGEPLTSHVSTAWRLTPDALRQIVNHGSASIHSPPAEHAP